MTRLTYVVNGYEVATYQEALDFSKFFNAPITKRYSPIKESELHFTASERAKIQSFEPPINDSSLN